MKIVVIGGGGLIGKKLVSLGEQSFSRFHDAPQALFGLF